MSRLRNNFGQSCLRRWGAGMLGLGMLGVASLSQAMDLWVGAAAGRTSFDPSRLAAPVLSGSLDDTDTGWKLMFGGPMFDNFALEFSILKLGNFSGSNGSASISNEAKGWAVEGIGMFPLGKSFALMARYGLFRHDMDTVCNVGASLCGGNATVLDATYGAGVQYGMTKGINLRAEWQRFEGLGDQTSSEGDIDMLSIGVLYWF